MATPILYPQSATRNGAYMPQPTNTPAPTATDLDTIRALFRQNLQAAGLPTKYADLVQEPPARANERTPGSALARIKATLLELDPERLAVVECLIGAFLQADGIPA